MGVGLYAGRLICEYIRQKVILEKFLQATDYTGTDDQTHKNKEEIYKIKHKLTPLQTNWH